MGLFNGHLAMTDKEKLELLQEVANAVVTCHAIPETMPLQLAKAIKALEIILVAIEARQEPVIINALNPEGAKPPPELMPMDARLERAENSGEADL